MDFLEADLVEVDIDLDSKVDAGGPDQGGETVELEMRIRFSITDDDKLTLPPQRFHGGPVFEVASVRQIDPAGGLVEHADHFPQEGRVPDPPLEPLEERVVALNQDFASLDLSPVLTRSRSNFEKRHSRCSSRYVREAESDGECRPGVVDSPTGIQH
ncbi:MAG: hypothetical protein VCA38_00070 [Roseibacillus sp.]